MPYYSWKDISGLFNLDYENAKYVNKPLIKLYLKPEINLLMKLVIMIISKVKKIFGKIIDIMINI